MKKILKQYLKQIIVVVTLLATVSILNLIFTGTSIRGEYDTVTVGVTEGTDARELKSYLLKSFKEELKINKKIEVEAVGSFGTEFRVKSDSIVADERDFIDIMLKEKYEDVSVSGITTNPEANYRVDVIMYSIYFLIIASLGFGAVYFLNLIPIDNEVNIKNIKKQREEIVKEEKKKPNKVSKKEKSKKETKEKSKKEIKEKSKKETKERTKKEKSKKETK